MTILAIETSCDETGIGIIKHTKSGFNIITNLIASQVKLHAPHGGIVPTIAKRAHIKNLPLLLKQAQINWDKVDYIAVTSGPGLDPCLWQGIEKAKKLAKKHNKKIIAVNHLIGHIYANWIKNYKKIKFPVLSLIVSGGHTQLVLMKNHLDFSIIGQTRDDAAGEAFDKVARLLGLGFPGGPIIEKKAQKGNKKKYDLPRPMINSKNYDFSFSGLKTAVLYLLRDKKKVNKSDVCACFQQAIIDVLISKTKKAINQFNPKTVVFGGGVMSNNALRQEIEKSLNSAYFIPPAKLCTDNAVMIAVAGYFKAQKNKFILEQKLKSQPNLNFQTY